MAEPAAKDPAEAEIARIARLSCWRGRAAVEPLSGGLSNRNYRVADASGRYVVRLGQDAPEHGIARRNEQAASRAAAAAGVSPELVHAQPGVMVFRFVEGRTLAAGDVRGEAMLPRVLALVKRAHERIAPHLRGARPRFQVFQALRGYARTLERGASRMTRELPRLLAASQELERAAGKEEARFCHNDLLAANLIDDGERLWLIDWEYGGFNAPLFDLGNLASNNALSPGQTDWLLAQYDGRAPAAGRRLALQAMIGASLLREAMWSMVQEIHSKLPIDYAAYTGENLGRFEAAWARFADCESR
ncbi:MAG: phosphotransferase [Rhodospirillales bacterium]